jgi:phosphate-selective porin OprO and OprP
MAINNRAAQRIRAPLLVFSGSRPNRSKPTAILAVVVAIFVNEMGSSSSAQSAFNDPIATLAHTEQPVRLPAVAPPAQLLASFSGPSLPDYQPGSLPDVLKRLEATEAELRVLRGQNVPHSGGSGVNLTAFQPPGNGSPEPRDPTPSGEKRLPHAIRDQFPTYRLTGFTQLDGAWYSQDARNRATVGDAQDGVGFRRVRLAVVGNAAEFTNYMVEVDFVAAGKPSLFDVWVEQGNLPILGAVRVGQYLQPFSVDAMSGFRNLPFLERSLPFLAFVPFRRVGVMSSNNTKDERTTWAYSVFKTGGFNNAPLGDSRFGTDIGDEGGYSFSTRVTHLVYYDESADDRYLWHLGGAFDYSRLGENTAPGSGTSGNAGGGPSPFYQTKVLPEFGPVGFPENSSTFGSAVNGTPSFVDSGKYAASSFNLYGLETVAQAGAWSLQAEFMGTTVNSVVGPIFYHGAYAEVMYRLTGETRPYDKKLGALRNVVPFTDFISLRPGGITGWGAWEVAARLSYVDINNPNALKGHYYNSATNTFTSTTGNVGNGLLTDSTVGLSWFLNAHSKLQFNWIHCMLDNKITGFSTADLFVTRAQVDF